MNIHYGQALVIHRGGDHAEIDGIVDDRFHDLGPFQPADLHAHIGIKLFEFGKDLRQDVQTRAFIRANHDFAARDALHFRHRNQQGLARFQRLLAYCWKTLPAAVSATLPPLRSKSLAPTSSSRARICEEMAGCVRKRFSAAREKLVWRATSRKVSS